MPEPSIHRKLRVLASAAKYDASCASSGSKGRNEKGLGSTQGMGICHSYTPDGRCISLLKVLMTNVCIYDCAYCVSRRSSGVERATFEPDELVTLTLDFYRRNYIEGLFLSSAVRRSADDTMERMISIAQRLREREAFAGYIHLKAVAGASDALIRKAGRYADRVSVNIELPSRADLSRLAPEKEGEQIEGSMGALREAIDESIQARRSRRIKRKEMIAPAGQSTQMIVGATPSPDRLVLNTAHHLYTRYRMRRVYYSGYSPIPFAAAGMPAKAPPLVREHRLYQADWLLRFYGFDVDEIASEADPNLRLDIDPKLAWALKHRELFPVDLNTAPRELLLRVPGLGVRNAQKIIASRRHIPITMTVLQRMRVALRKVAPFVITRDRNPAPLRWLEHANLEAQVKPQQLSLFDQPLQT